MKIKLFYYLLAIFYVIFSSQSLSFNSVYLPIENLTTYFLNTPEKIDNFIKLHREAANASERTVNVTIIGGGPGGLASAVYAYLAGAKVVLVEKRTMYVRQQVLALEIDNIKQLVEENFLGIESSENLLVELEINRLEEMLYSVIRDIAQEDPKNMKVFYGYELRELALGQGTGTKIVVHPFQDTQNISIEIPTDFLIGADSIHSAVRKLAKIPVMILTNEVPVMVAVYKNQNQEETEKIVEERYCHREAAQRASRRAKNTQKLDELLVQDDRELFYHNERLIYLALQLTENQYNILKNTKDTIAVAQNIIDETLFEPGFFKKLSLVDPLGHQTYPTVFKVDLRKAKQFAKVVDGMLITLIGDAAGTTHFFAGTGANRALQDAKAIGQLVRSFVSSKTLDLNTLADTYNNITVESVSKMQRQVLAAKMGVEQKLEQLETPWHSPSSKYLH